MIDPADLRYQLADSAPKLRSEIDELATAWLNPVISFLNRRTATWGFPKTFNDPIWGVIELLPWETALLDSPLLQRLRGVRQLGFAHYVYPAACHDRLEHSIGVVQAAELMIQALTRNAKHRQSFGDAPDKDIPEPSDMDKKSTRLAALLHDIGHGPFSHLSEPLLRNRRLSEFERVENVIRTTFDGVTQISTSETIAVLFVMSESMRQVFEHPKFGAVNSPAELPVTITARMVGSRSCLNATYLSGIISGPLDADKLDYMARDSHHSGLPLGLDINRLISKLEVVTVTENNARNPEMRDRAVNLPNKRFYEIGISASGLAAYEQMVIGRVILYDRIYYHHKVRATEAMVRRLITLTEEEGGRKFKLPELLQAAADDSMVRILSGEMRSKSKPLGKARANAMGRAILNRQVYYRAFAFAARFIDGLGGLPIGEQQDTRALLWNLVLSALSSLQGCKDLETEIYNKALLIAQSVPDLSKTIEGLRQEHVIVDIAPNKVVVRGSDILIRTESGHVDIPNLFFDSERWSQAYESQKQCGFVFTPREYVPIIALASRVVFIEKFQLSMIPLAASVSKLVEVVKPAWVQQAGKKGACSAECVKALTEPKPTLVRIREDELKLPNSWKLEDPELAKRLSEGFRDILPAGLPSSLHNAVIDAIEHIVLFLDMIEKDGSFSGVSSLSEKELQTSLRRHLRSRSVNVQEGTKIGGGETDLVLPGPLVVENKVRKELTAKPLESGPHYVWQARRYSIAVVTRVMFVVVGYRPANEAAILPLTKRIIVASPVESPDGYAQVRVVLPWGHAKPSKAKAGLKVKKGTVKKKP